MHSRSSTAMASACISRDWTQDSTHAKQALYYMWWYYSEYTAYIIVC